MPRPNNQSWNTQGPNNIRTLALVMSGSVLGLLLVSALTCKFILFQGQFDWRNIAAAYLFCSTIVWLVHHFLGEHSFDLLFGLVFALAFVFFAPFLFLFVLALIVFSPPKKRSKEISKKRPQLKNKQYATSIFTVGDLVEFHPPGHACVKGLIAQLNRKTVKVVSDSPGIYWNVPPELLTKARQKSMSRKPLQLELIKGTGNELNERG